MPPQTTRPASGSALDLSTGRTDYNYRHDLSLLQNHSTPYPDFGGTQPKAPGESTLTTYRSPTCPASLIPVEQEKPSKSPPAHDHPSDMIDWSGPADNPGPYFKPLVLMPAKLWQFAPQESPASAPPPIPPRPRCISECTREPPVSVEPPPIASSTLQVPGTTGKQPSDTVASQLRSHRRTPPPIPPRPHRGIHHELVDQSISPDLFREILVNPEPPPAARNFPGESYFYVALWC